MRKVSLFIALMLCLTMPSSAMAIACTTTVSMPEDIPGLTGQIATAPVNISDANGVQAFDFVITYDTALLDLSSSDVLPGSLTGSGWSITPNVDDSIGQAAVSAYATTPLGAVSGSLLELDFHVTATAGLSPLMPCGSLNEGNIIACFDDGSIEIVPEPTIGVSLLCLLVAAVFVFNKRR